MTTPHDTLCLKIEAMKANGVDRYDPVRFCYIQSMIQRANEKSAAVYEIIAKKAAAEIAAYQADFNNARHEAAEMINHHYPLPPEEEDNIRRLFENNEFKKIKRLIRKIARRHRQTELSLLTDQLEQFTSGLDEKNNSLSPSFIDDLLRRQERDVVLSVENFAAKNAPVLPAEKNQTSALLRFKETIAKVYSDRLITQAVHDLPENAGPHNSQMLATRSLSALHKISPNYLNRFISHIGTLIWLKQIGEDAEKMKSKKSKPGYLHPSS